MLEPLRRIPSLQWTSRRLAERDVYVICRRLTVVLVLLIYRAVVEVHEVQGFALIGVAKHRPRERALEIVTGHFP